MPNASFVNVNAAHATDPTIPAHTGGDWLGALIETTSGAITGMAGWSKRAEIPNNVGSTQWTLYLRKVAVGETVPTPNLGGGSNHTIAKVFVVRDADPDDPILDISTSQELTASTSHTLPGLLVKGQTNTLVMQGFAWATDVATPSSSAWTNAALASITLRSEDGTTVGDGGGIAFATGVLVADNAHTGFATVTTTSILALGFCIAFRNAPSAPAFAVPPNSKCKDFDGNPAPDGGTVHILDTVLGVIETTAIVFGGDGSYTAALKHNTALRYRTIYDNLVDPPGCSVLWTAV